MKRKEILSMLVVLVLVFAGTLWAGETGEVFGSVEFEGSLIPGVRVEADSAQLTEKRSTLSSEEGVFRFEKLPAGEYSFTFKLLGFKTILLKGIKVKPGKKIELIPRMKLAAIIEEIVVLGIRKGGAGKKDESRSPAKKPDGIASIEAPKLMKKVKPEYPREALEKGFSGDVVIKAVINEQGNLTNMKVEEGHYACLIASAVEALKHWKYKPVLMDGTPRESDVSIKVTFQLKTEK